MTSALRLALVVFALQLLACAGEETPSGRAPVDPKTGRKTLSANGDEANLGSLAKQARAALPKGALSRSMRGLTPQRMSDGIKRLRLPDRLEHASVAVVDEDGVVRSVCIDGAGEQSAPQDAP